MPVARYGVQRAPLQFRFSQLSNYVDQPDQSAQHVQRMRDRQKVEERTAGISGQVESRTPELGTKRRIVR